MCWGGKYKTSVPTRPEVKMCVHVWQLGVSRADQRSANKLKNVLGMSRRRENLWALILLLEFWQRLEGDSAALFKALLQFSCKSHFQTGFCVVSFARRKILQSNNMEMWRSGITAASISHSFFSTLCSWSLWHSYWALLWLVKGLSTISIRNATAAGLITASQRGTRWEDCVAAECRDEDLMLICEFKIIVRFRVSDSRDQ